MDRMLRVHSIATAEMARLTPREAVERYVRAAAERNIRLNYVRLPGSTSGDLYADTLAYLHDISKGIAAEDLGLQNPLPPPLAPVWSQPLLGRLAAAGVGLGVGAGGVLLLALLVPIARGAQLRLGVAAALGCAAAAVTGLGLAQQALALLAAVVFPTSALLLFPQPVAAFEEHEHAAVRERSQSVVPAAAEFAGMCLVTLSGAVMVAALLSELPYMVKVRSFAGIKLAHVAPLLIVGWVYLTGMTGLYPTWTEERSAVTERLGRFLSEPLRIWQTVAALVGLVVLVLLVARSGNDAGVGVSPTELRFRALLDRVLGVRPRTKEFLVGHPAMLLALAMATAPAARRWTLPVLLVGIIGQVSMLNSFCHLHTPIKMTLLRTLNGLWTGGLLGLVLIFIWNRIARWVGAREGPLRT
jgi:hypothetical protein